MGAEKARSWNSPTMLPRTIQPKSPPERALSSEYVRATSANAVPSSNFANASKIFDCYNRGRSQKGPGKLASTLLEVTLPNGCLPDFNGPTVIECIVAQMRSEERGYEPSRRGCGGP